MSVEPDRARGVLLGLAFGAVAGARFGASGLPDGWLDVLESRHELESLADELAR